MVSTHSWLASSGRRPSGPRLAAAAAALLGGVVFLAAWAQVGRWRDERDLQVLRNGVTAGLGAHRNALTSALANRFALLEGLRAFVEVKVSSGERFDGQYDDFAGRLYGVARGTRNLAVAEGSTYRLVYPRIGNERVVGYDLLADDRAAVVEDTRRAMTRPGIAVGGPYELKQGGIGLVAREAVTVQGRYWGLVAIAMDLQPILEDARLVPANHALEIGVRAPGHTPFFGTADVFAGDPVVQRVDLPDGHWEIAARPAGGWQAPGSAARRAWLFSGGVIALVPMALVFVLTWRERVLRAARLDADRRVREGTGELARTTDLLESVLRASPLPIVVFDERGVIRVWSAAAERVFGWTAEEAVGRPNPIVAPDNEAEFASLQERVKNGETLNGLEVQRRRKDGRVIDLRLFTAPVLDARGRFVGVMGLVEDVTERKRIERDLRLAKVVVENSPVVLIRWRHGEGWPVEYISENVSQFGYRADDLVAGKVSYDAIVHPDDIARVARECDEAIAAGEKHFRQEYRIRTSDGRTRWMEDRTAVFTAPDGTRFYEGIVLDVTDRKVSEETRREVERRLREMLDNIHIVAVMLDRDARVTFCNACLVRLTGWSREELIGRDWFETCVPAGIRERARADFLASIESGLSSGESESPLLARDGELRDISWHNTILRDSGGHVVGSAGFGRDVTDQRQLEAQYRQAQKMEAIGQLAGGVAHDFNNLLQVISGYAAIALAELAPEQALYPELNEIRRAAERATVLVRQLLAFSRRQKIERRALDVNETIADLLKMLRRLIGEHIELDFAPGYDVEKVFADAGLLEQVLMNLCVNARDVMPEGGRISISTANVTIGSDFIEQRAWGQEGRYVLLTVADTGPGIPPGLQDRIFEPFFTTKDVGKGTGLGLATVYGIVKQHEGMIEVAREVSAGAAFRIYLPVADRAEMPADRRTRTDAVQGGHETILLAEDEELVRSLAKRVLERAGYRVLLARDGGEAIALVEARAAEIDLALLDVVMPRASGREVKARLKAVRPEVPVVFCTGYARQVLDGSWAPDDGVELLLKPYEPAVLLKRVRARLGRRADTA